MTKIDEKYIIDKMIDSAMKYIVENLLEILGLKKKYIRLEDLMMTEPLPTELVVMYFEQSQDYEESSNNWGE